MNSVDPDEMAHYEPSHLALHCLKRYLYWTVTITSESVVMTKLNTVECSDSFELYFVLKILHY